MITKIFLLPPLAFARLGPSETPCDAFHWGPNDMRPRGTGKTTILPSETLRVASDGTVTKSVPRELVFKDAAGFRPVAPFFELHGEWTERGRLRSGPITKDVLRAFGLRLTDVTWRVHVANLKPYHHTLVEGDRIETTLDVPGDAHDRRTLRGRSPAALVPLVPPRRGIPLGSVQVTKPDRAFPELRLRFTPAKGFVYGPIDLERRLQDLLRRYPGSRWRTLSLPKERQILDPAADWCRFVAPRRDPRTVPEGLYAFEDENDLTGVGLGMVDDICDGIVSCTLPDLPPATARIVVGPPDYAPDRRPFTSLADGLKDRVDRDDVRGAAYVRDADATSGEVRDFMERVLETMELVNVDFQNERTGQANSPGGTRQRRHRAFPEPEIFGETALPLTEKGRQRHRRFVSLAIFEDILREQPDLIERMVRTADTGTSTTFDARMPAAMRGADGGAMFITRRQYDLLQAWVTRLRRDIERNS